MPVHMFISLGNILSKQFKDEADKQKEEDEKAKASMPSTPSLPDFGSLVSSMSNNFHL